MGHPCEDSGNDWSPKITDSQVVEAATLDRVYGDRLSCGFANPETSSASQPVVQRGKVLPPTQLEDRWILDVTEVGVLIQQDRGDTAVHVVTNFQWRRLCHVAPVVCETGDGGVQGPKGRVVGRAVLRGNEREAVAEGTADVGLQRGGRNHDALVLGECGRPGSKPVNPLPSRRRSHDESQSQAMVGWGVQRGREFHAISEDQRLGYGAVAPGLLKLPRDEECSRGLGGESVPHQRPQDHPRQIMQTLWTEKWTVNLQ